MTAAPDRLAAAILAGGDATRYAGRAKGCLDAGGGRSILRRMLDELALAGLDKAIVCANDPAPYAPLGRPVVADLRRGAGPLGGIEAALTHYAGRREAVLLLPCDLPGIGAAEIGSLAAAHAAGGARVVVAETGDGFRHPLCAVVDCGVLGEVSAAIDAGRLGVGALWRELGAVGVRFADEAPLFNVNTPADLARWRRRGGRP